MSPLSISLKGYMELRQDLEQGRKDSVLAIRQLLEGVADGNLGGSKECESLL